MKKLSPAEIFLDHFNRILRREPELYLEPNLEEGIPGVTSLVYKDYPQPGFVTGISYGLSLQNNLEWSS